MWYKYDNTLHWNTDRNIEDFLHNGDGNTFSGFMPEGCKFVDEYLITNLDTEQGTWCTYIFKYVDQVTLEEF